MLWRTKNTAQFAEPNLIFMFPLTLRPDSKIGRVWDGSAAAAEYREKHAIKWSLTGILLLIKVQNVDGNSQSASYSCIRNPQGIRHPLCQFGLAAKSPDTGVLPSKKIRLGLKCMEPWRGRISLAGKKGQPFLILLLWEYGRLAASPTAADASMKKTISDNCCAGQGADRAECCLFSLGTN